MTIPQLFLAGYTIAFTLGGIVAWVYQSVKINELEAKISRLSQKRKSNGRFK